VQQAISQLVLDQGSNTFTEEQSIVIVEHGIYAAFIIPENVLKPTALYRLTIGAANGILPIIDFYKTQVMTGSFTNGCLIGTGTSYVTIRRMYFRGFQKGIVTGPNCHNLIIEKNVVLSSINVGILIYQSDQAQIINNMVFNAKYGIVTTLVKDIAIIYNTVFNDQLASTDTDTCLYLELQKDRGNTWLDHGKATVINNLLYTISGNSILINQRDLSNLQSNFNNIYSLSGNVAKVREVLSSGAVSETFIETLATWRATTLNDMLSISQDPVFIVQNTQVNSSSIDLNLLPSSPCILMGKLLCGDPTNDLDDYIDDSLLCADILGKNRGSAPTIGANEISVADGFYGTTVETSPDLQNADSIECTIGGALSHIDAVSEQYQSSVDCWMPEIKSGFFFVREKPYYLYAKKSAYTLSALRQTIFIMPRPISYPVIYVSGKKVTDINSYEILGDKFLLKHKGLDITSEADVISIQGKVRLWSSDHQKFTLRDVVYRFRMRDGIKRYVFPEEPKDAGPVVITDDTVALLDSSDMLPYEFYTSYSDEGARLNFHQDTNMVLNPQFEYGNSVSDLISDYSMDTSDFQYVANPFLRLQDDTGLAHLLNDRYSTKVNDPTNLNVTQQFVARTLGSTTLMHAGAEIPFDYILKTDGRISSRSVVQVSGYDSVRPLMGKNMLVFDVPTGDYSDHYIAQEVDHIDPDQNYFFSMYVSAPNATGKLYFDFTTYDGNDVLIKNNTGYSHTLSSDVSLVSNASPWQRVGIGLGNLLEDYPVAKYVTSDPVVSSDIIKIDSGLIAIEENARKIQLKIYSETGNPVAIDCLQFEAGYEATRYNRIPKESDATVEYESTDSGFYEVSDLTLSPMRNSAVNGFLQIGPVPASDFDETAPYNSTILTDWFWPAGRLKYLPWSKTSGKNKMSRSVYKHNSGSFVDRDITWDIASLGPSQIIVAQDKLFCVQNHEPQFMSIKVLNENQNAYAFKNLTVEIMESEGRYPGAIVHKELGFPDKYGQVVDISTDISGVSNIFVEPPSVADIQYRGNKPLVNSSTVFTSGSSMDKHYGKLEVDYGISNVSQGNIVVRDQNLVNYSLESASVYTQTLSPNVAANGITTYNLDDYAVIGSIICKISGAADFDIRLSPSYQQKPGFGQFVYDSTRGKISLAGNETRPIQVTYNRVLAWATVDEPNSINIDKTVLDQITGDIIVDYDAEVDLKITANAPKKVAGIAAKHILLKVIAKTPFKNTVAWSFTQ
jgi:hypothetical protein